ncbi:MAG: tetratricopeptide repeat protein [Daejeonella sp.]|uniref:tetratricopeptide repeat protein n=1 Tax=Daejeonella sp. TaxID=2805397 RepID=UPI003C717D4F
MLNKKQVLVVGSAVILMGFMLSMDIQGLVKPNAESGNAPVASQAAAPVKTYSLEDVSEISKQTLTANLNKQVSDLEGELKSASENEKVELQRKLAQQWDDLNQAAPAAFYYELIAQKEPGYTPWLKAGDKFTDAYQQTLDTLMQPALVQKAIQAYKEADKLQPNTPEVKTGLGIAYVTGTPNPMQGIQLLLEVVKNDPKNLKANLNLGLFSMKSGQYEKAVERFKTVIEQAPTAEAWFYLASSYENMGMKSDAIGAYLKTKEIAADPNMSQFVDRKVNELSN